MQMKAARLFYGGGEALVSQAWPSLDVLPL